jgi:hypothetical protein
MAPNPTVTLTPYESELAAGVGLRRHLSALRRGLVNHHGYKGDGWGDHIEAAGAELAVAKFLGRYWSGSVDTFKASGDVGPYEVRWRSSTTYDLLIRPGDADDRPFFLVLGQFPTYRVVGWIMGRDGKREEWRQHYGDRPAAFFVPQSALHPPTEEIPE